VWRTDGRTERLKDRFAEEYTALAKLALRSAVKRYAHPNYDKQTEKLALANKRN